MTSIKEYLLNGSKDPIVDFVEMDRNGIMQSQIAIYQLGQEKDKNYYILSANKNIDEFIKKNTSGIDFTEKIDSLRPAIKTGNQVCVFGEDNLRVFMEIIHKYDLVFNRQLIALESPIRIPNPELVQFGNDIQPKIEGVYLDKLYTIVKNEWDKFLTAR